MKEELELITTLLTFAKIQHVIGWVILLMSIGLIGMLIGGINDSIVKRFLPWIMHIIFVYVLMLIGYLMLETLF